MAKGKLLTLVRHAKSDWNNSFESDFERGLNTRGKRDAPEMGRRLKTALALPDLVLCSSAVRAQLTADLLLPEMGINTDKIKTVQQIYEASTDTLLKLVAGTDDKIAHLMLIGHNPGLASLCNRLLTGAVASMPTCAVSCFKLGSDNWADLLDSDNSLVMHDFPKNQE